MKILMLLFLGIIVLIYGCRKGTTEFEQINPEIIQWQPFVSSPANTLLKLEIDSAGKIYASAVAGLFVSEDDGNTWKLIYNSIQPRNFEVSPIDGRIMISAVW